MLIEKITKAYSSVVERTAHNGLDVGSNPTKLTNWFFNFNYIKKSFKIMKITLKNYKILTTKQYLKTTNLFFFFNGIDQSSKDLLQMKQELKNINFNCYKVFNKTSKEIFKNSIYKNMTPIINSGTFFIKPIINYNKPLSKKNLFNNFENLIFIFLAGKINNKIYFSYQFKSMNTLNYRLSKLLLYQFLTTSLKNKYFQLTKIK